MGKYCTGDYPNFYPDSNVLQYLLNIEADEERAEAELTELAVEKIELDTPPHDLHDFQSLHRELFEGDDESAGELCGVEMLTAGAIRFCT